MSDGVLVRGRSVVSPVRDVDALEFDKSGDKHGLKRQEKDDDGKAQP
jgi:hypothetical protein